MSNKGVAIVTGASQGIGRAIALHLAEDGYDIAINDIYQKEENLKSLREEIVQKGRKVAICIGDISVESVVVGIVEKAVEELGSLDVMVANAGICEPSGPIADSSIHDWERTFAINVRGSYLCYRAAAQQMIKQGRGGRIIGASSTVGKQGLSGMAAYCASKFAIRGLTQSVAAELGKHGITVNAYAPGAVDTPMLQNAAKAVGNAEELYNHEVNLTAVGFIGNPDDIASFVCYLASKEARFITGQTVCINGGRFFD